MSNFETPIPNLNRNWEQWRRQFPEAASVDAMNFFKRSFRNQGFTNRNLVKWQQRKNQGKRNKGRAILVQSGKLRRSFRPSFNSHSIGVQNYQPYASTHNDGLRHPRSKTKRMPKRQFMGNSKALMDELEANMLNDIEQNWLKS